MTNRNDVRFQISATPRTIAVGQAMLLLPMLSAVLPLTLGASAVTVMSCIAAATVAMVVVCGIIVVSVHDRILQRQRDLEAELSAWESRALTDPLTSIPNRRGIEARAAFVEADRNDVTWTVLSFDVDLFKSINDYYGHPVGDRALVLLAETLDAHCPEGAWVGRLGGDEFVAFSDDPAVLNDQWANEFRRTLASRSLKTREGSVRLQVTYGRSLGAPGEPFSTVFDAADASLVLRKAARRAGAVGVTGLTDSELETVRRRSVLH